MVHPFTSPTAETRRNTADLWYSWWMHFYTTFIKLNKIDCWFFFLSRVVVCCSSMLFFPSLVVRHASHYFQTLKLHSIASVSVCVVSWKYVCGRGDWSSAYGPSGVCLKWECPHKHINRLSCQRLLALQEKYFTIMDFCAFSITWPSLDWRERFIFFIANYRCPKAHWAEIKRE